MSPTANQLRRNARVKKVRRSKCAAFEGAPFRKGVVYKIAVMSPRKPNSARRTYAKVRLLFNGKRVFAKIPGMVIIICKLILLFWLEGMGLKIVLA